MKLSACIGSWKDELCADLSEEFTAESFEELLETINLGEKINSKYDVVAEWCSDYYWTSESLLQPIYLESANPYNSII